jgi:isoamylase
LIRVYKDHNVFSRREWFKGQPIKGRRLTDIAWFSPDGKKMTEENWQAGFAKSLAVYLDGHGIHSKNYDGKPILDDSFYLIFNAHSEPVEYKLQTKRYGHSWIKILDTGKNFVSEHGGEPYKANSKIIADGFSVMLLKYPLAH